MLFSSLVHLTWLSIIVLEKQTNITKNSLNSQRKIHLDLPRKYCCKISFQVIPPGMDFSSVVVQEDAPEVDGELATLISSTDGSSPKAIPPIWSEVSATLCFPCCFT